jgi:hypothetical protein
MHRQQVLHTTSFGFLTPFVISIENLASGVPVLAYGKILFVKTLSGVKSPSAYQITITTSICRTMERFSTGKSATY